MNALFQLSFLVTAFSLGVVQVTALGYNESDALRAQRFSTAAYCNNSFIYQWGCEACQSEPRFELSTGQAIVFKDLQGYTGYDPQSNRIVVAFRGTVNWQNLLRDINGILKVYTRVPLVGRKAAKVHTGIFDAYFNLLSPKRGNMVVEVQKLLATHPTASLLYTGHSLGGAMAHIAAIDFKLNANWFPPAKYGVNSRLVEIYSFGSPRWCNSRMSQVYDSLLGQTSFRVTNRKDIVATLPTRRILVDPKRLLWRATGYKHVSQQVQYTSPSKFQICQKPEDPKCFTFSATPSKIDHSLYLGNRFKCRKDESD